MPKLFRRGRISNKPMAKASWQDRTRIIGRYVRSIYSYNKGFKYNLTHSLGHVQRVGHYAAFLARISGARPETVNKAEIAGLTHDISLVIKDANHEVESAKFMKKMILRRYGKRDTDLIIHAIKSHRFFPSTRSSIISSSVLFADKIFENSGAYGVFRLALDLGEAPARVKYAKRIGFKPAAIEFLEEKLKKSIHTYSAATVPSHLNKLFTYQLNWQLRFLNALKSQEIWAENIATNFFKIPQKRPRASIEEIIKGFKPIEARDNRFKEEALKYINGKKDAFFRQTCI